VTRQDAPEPGLLELLKLDRIRTKLLVFAVVIAVLPAFAAGWVSYSGSKRDLRERIGLSLQTSARQGARETEIWFDERLHELRVFAGSDAMLDNLEPARGGGGARARLREYFGRVQNRIDDFLLLQANAPDGRPLASNNDREVIALASPQLAELRSGRAVFGEVERDSTLGPVMTLAVPVLTADGRVLGSLAVRLRLRSLAARLAPLTPDDGGLLLMELDGKVVPVRSSTRGTPDSVTLAMLLAPGGKPAEFHDHRGMPMIGSVVQMSGAPWFAVAELSQDQAYLELYQLRNLVLLAVFGLALVLGGVGYLIGLHVVRPIDSLTQAASRVASGHLEVELPVVGHDEVASLTVVFNDMVRELRQDRRKIAAMDEQLKRRNLELEELSITDGLTGLRNRRHIMATLEHEVSRAQRTRRPLAVMMLDVDHFKRLNDRFGHQTGDEVLIKVAGVVRSAVRNLDGAGRYGGEEFIVVLPETDRSGARDVAERIRRMVESTIFAQGEVTVTLSIGVATFPADGDDAARVIAAADAALYRAKEGGRNRVEVATGPVRPVT
jgi:diguanylate cyclase (GGDEF)-like protein